MLNFILLLFTCFFFNFLNANELVKKFENEDFEKLLEKLKDYNKLSLDLDLKKNFPNSLEFCNDIYISQEIINSFDIERASKDIFYQDVISEIGDLHIKCNTEVVLSDYGYEVSEKTLDNLKKSIEIQEKLFFPTYDRSTREYAQDILDYYYYHRAAHIHWIRAIRKMDQNPDECHDEILLAMKYSKPLWQDSKNLLTNDVNVNTLEAMCFFRKLSIVSTVDSYDLLNLKFKKMLTKFNDHSDKVDIFVDYIYLSFLNLERFDLKEVNKIKKQKEYLNNLINKTDQNEVFKKLVSFHNNLFWLRLAYFSQPLIDVFQTELEDAYKNIEKNLNESILKNTLPNLIYKGLQNESVKYKNAYALVTNKIQSISSLLDENRSFLEKARQTNDMKEYSSYDQFTFYLMANVLGDKKFFNKKTYSMNLSDIDNKMAKEIRKKGDEILEKYNNEIKKYDILKKYPQTHLYNQMITGLIELFSNQSQKALPRILNVYKSPFFNGNDFYVSYLHNNLEPIILTLSTKEKNQILELLLLSESLDQEFNLSRVIDLAKLKNNEIKKINANLEKKKKKYSQLLKSVSQKNITNFQDEVSKIENDILEIKNEMNQNYPNISLFSNKTNFNPNNFFHLIEDDEAIVKYLNYKSSDGEASFIILLKKNYLKIFELPINKLIKRKIDKYMKVVSNPKSFDFNLSHYIYKKIFEPIKYELNGIKKIIFIRDKNFENLPFHTLVLENKNLYNESSEIKKSNLKELKNTRGVKVLNDLPLSKIDLINTKWLIDEYAVSYLPSLKSFDVLRNRQKLNKYQRKFVGFGNPNINGGINCLKKFSHSKFFRGNHTLNDLNEFCPLPETENEINLMDKALKSENNLIFTKENANELNFKNLNNSSIEVLTIASHGIISGGLNGLTESALLMSPPKKLSESDDGLLKADEIAMTNINTKLVILSACNTATKEDKNSFKSLPMSFFYSGAQNILVSGWPVETQSTLKITSELINNYSKSSKSIAMDLKESLLKIKQKKEYSHPFFWGAFSLFGD